MPPTWRSTARPSGVLSAGTTPGSGPAGSIWPLGAGRTPTTADLIAGNTDVRPDAGGLLARALAAMPIQVCGRPRVRADAGYSDATLAHTAVKLGCGCLIAAKRNCAAWRALSGVPDSEWRDARGMHSGRVAACDYAPAGWPDGTYTIIRRVKISVEKLSADPRSQRRRTVAKDQLALALGGAADRVWAVSFIVTNCRRTTSSGWNRGSATAPRSRNASVRSSTAVA